MSAAQDFRIAMVEFTENTEPLREWAKGYREALTRDGWSETQAERIAADALIQLFRKVMSQ